MMIDDANINPRNLIPVYGRLTIKDIMNHAMTYISQQTRKAQKYVQMYHCIYNSITKATHLNIMEEMQKYTAQVTPMGQLWKNLDGILWKVNSTRRGERNPWQEPGATARTDKRGVGDSGIDTGDAQVGG